MEDLTGRVFGRWTAVALAGKVKNGRAAYECRCECGTVRVVAASHLRDGSSSSCGCRRSEVTARRNTKHGMADTPEHNIWRLMKVRCLNKRHWAYRYYGGRGVKVCRRWLDSFTNFYEDMGPRPSPNHTLDRYPDTAGDYEPANCRWATWEQQQNNRRNNRRLTHGGVTKNLAEWGRATGLDPTLIRHRIDRRGWPVGAALTTPAADRRRLLTLGGVTRTLAEWARATGISKLTIAGRLRRGWPAEEALKTPPWGRARSKTAAGGASRGAPPAAGEAAG